ncbi:MAG: hypothetical protein AAGG45_00850, partial [Pseudomonadota bacterium]
RQGMAHIQDALKQEASFFKEAGELYQLTAPSKALDAFRQATALDPSDFWSLGNLATARGQLEDAHRHFTESLETRRALAKDNPTSAEAKRDLIVSYWKLAQITGELIWWQRALPVVEDMAERGILAPTDAWMLDDIREKAAE